MNPSAKVEGTFSLNVHACIDTMSSRKQVADALLEVVRQLLMCDLDSNLILSTDEVCVGSWSIENEP
jgi:hypothetical protein